MAMQDTLINALPGGETAVRWPLPDEFVSSPEVAYRNRFAEALSQKSVEEIVARFVYLAPEQMRRLVETGCRAVGAPSLRGTGLELGAGCGLLSSTVAGLPGVERVIAVEVCEEAVRSLIPKVARGLLGNASNKVVPVIGSFDDVRLRDNSVDFIVEIDSFHHSGDLARTFGECHRVLRPGGVAICFDRCHPDSLSDEEVDRMLSEVYSEHFLAANHYPPGVTLTRRQNGEHEYRLFEWKSGFEKAGLKLLKAASLAKEVPFRKAVKGCLSVTPGPVRRLVYQTDNADLTTTWEWIAQPFRTVFSSAQFGRAVLAPKETSVFLLEKPR
jgi:SAM-dependent methyltransferase